MLKDGDYFLKKYENMKLLEKWEIHKISRKTRHSFIVMDSLLALRVGDSVLENFLSEVPCWN